ncbi:hypothetical protein CRM22_004863 [Opisthorchis felineus]|uniref:EGF-like domain-containing protein n=1 Tax=Opisthorchis felineus TaxID=147828 RepID=A0A4S2LV47_OPIFE|nr:hypothetical protein CRM22_004863 [Opisthorchis felineus]
MDLCFWVHLCKLVTSLHFPLFALLPSQGLATVILTATQTERLPPIYLKPFKTNGDIRYGYFNLPETCLNSRISVSITLDSNCTGPSLNLFLRPGSLPLVQPFDVEVPRGVVLLPDTLILSVSFKDGASPTSKWRGFKGTDVELSVSKSGTAASLDCNIYSPASGSWFFGAYTSVNSGRTDCYLQLFPQINNEVITNAEPLTLRSPVPHSTVAPTEVPRVDHTRDQLHLRLISSFRPRLQTSRKKLFTSRYLRDTTNRTNVPQPNTSGLSNERSEAEANDRTSITLELLPARGKLFRFRLPNGVNSVDLIIEECSVTATSVLENESFPESSASSQCPILLDASRGAIPTALASHMRQLPQSSNSHSGALNNLSVFQHSLNLPVYRFQGKRYRFDALQGSRVAHYLYLRNLAHFGTMTLRLSFTHHFSCSFAMQTAHSPSAEYQPPYQNKRYSPLLSVLRDTTTTNKTQASGKQAVPSSQSNPRNLSLLSWVNANWPKLTMERRTRQMLKQRAEMDHSSSQQDAFVDPELLLHKTFEKCSVWNAPSRVSMHYAFAYHFTYKPESGQYTNGLRIPPWHAIAIPFDLAPSLDTGGSLEVTLQLNPFDLMQHINHTHSLPLPRQVILHACLSRHVPTSPYDFISRKRCPLWLRLATHRGVAVSVAHAVFAAVSATLARSQPSHRSELPPLFDTSFDEAVDRSFLYLPYPSPGQWFLGLYAECYAASDVRWCEDPASAVDVGLVIQSRPCLNYRCRESGEGASLPPSRVLSRAAAEVQPVVQDQTSSTLTPRWRPPWWNLRKPDHAAYQSPLVNSTWQASSLFGEGLCVELLQQSIFASTCACPPGRFGLGCLRPNSTELVDDPLPHGRELDELIYMWNGYSKDALLLALTNLAFVPGICLALTRRLWVPALAYTYTLVFSALYHLCDTDVMNIPARVGLRTISGGAASFGGYSLVRARGYHVVSTAPNGYHSVPHGFRFTSPACPLPLDILSFCDFFGGVLSVLVTMIAACACPLRYAQLAYVISMLFLSIAVQVARYSVGLFLIPSAVGFVILAFSWILRTRQTGRLFPPVQWWILSLFPGLVCAGTGLCLFLSPWMAREYTKLHSLWHILIGCSLIGLLPWPSRWRTALAVTIPRSVPLSCGGTIYDQGSCTLHSGTNPRFSKRRFVSRLIKRTWKATSPDRSFSNSFAISPVFGHRGRNIFSPVRCKWFLEPVSRWLWQLKRMCHIFHRKLDSLLELDCLLDTVVARWPRCKWLLPHGYMPHRSDRADYAPDVQTVSAAQPHVCSGDSSRSPLTQPKVLRVDSTGDNSPTTVSDNII